VDKKNSSTQEEVARATAQRYHPAEKLRQDKAVRGGRIEKNLVSVGGEGGKLSLKLLDIKGLGDWR